MAGINFLRARSPVTPKITSEQGPAMRGRRLSRLSRNGFVADEPFARRMSVMDEPFV
ncbi:Uncharacterised protein [Mycobacteroides abscessus subsp. massiliense]|nr:Uncharacterised protein [Mycobacteroides abscessus subsp. massiliense]